jgi:hypothetical protein
MNTAAAAQISRLMASTFVAVVGPDLYHQASRYRKALLTL